MNRRSKVWLVADVLFLAGNVAGAWFAAAQGELLHASVHAGLLLPAAYFLWWLAPKRRALGSSRQGQALTGAQSVGLTDRLTHLEHSVGAVAIEVERIGEGQRSITRHIAEDSTPPSLGEHAAEPGKIDPQDDAPREHHD